MVFGMKNSKLVKELFKKIVSKMHKKNQISIDGRIIGEGQIPLIIPEIGINHGGSFEKAKKMIKAAHKSGAECVKFQYHIPKEEMIENDVIPKNAKESIWNIIKKCSLSKNEEKKLKKYTEELNMIYLSTPFSKEAANRLEEMNVCAYKIGSGECNNYPLIKHIASFRKPIILSTGMNNLQSISKAVKILKKNNIEFVLMHTTSIYPTPYNLVRLGALNDLQKKFPDSVIGLSDHSLGINTCFAAIALGAKVLEKHFTISKKWKGPDISLSINPAELKDLIIGSTNISLSLGGYKNILPEEQSTIDFAYASVVSIREIKKNEKFTENNIWVKRPGTGKILATDFSKILKKRAKKKILKNTQLKWNMIE
jgi:N-acetylneuraminate synthase